MVSRMLIPVISLFVVLSPISMPTALGDDHGKLRMYKLNKKGQLVKQRWLKNTDEEGCHNTFKAREVHRVAQIDFAWCKVYKERDCAKGKAIKARWGGEKYKEAPFDIAKPQRKLVKGTEWIFKEGENVTIRSWECVYHEPGESS